MVVSTALTYYVTVTTLLAAQSAYYSNPLSPYILSYSAVAPVVSSLGPILLPTNTTAARSTSGGTQVTITGTKFFTGATVWFVPVPPAGGQSYQGTGVSVPMVGLTNETMTVYSPQVPAAGQYYVEVTTPGPLTSAPGPNDIFTYSAPIPNPAGS